MELLCWIYVYGKRLLEYKNLFSPGEYKKNFKIIIIINIIFAFVNRILKRLGWEESIVLIVKGINNLKSLKYHIFVMKYYFFAVFVLCVEVKMKKYLKKKNHLKY